LYRLSAICLGFKTQQRMLAGFRLNNWLEFMLITFKSTAGAPVQMFGQVALQLLEMMGRQAKSPGAFYAEDVPGALAKLQQALLSLPIEVMPSDAEAEQQSAVPLRRRALPLIQLMGLAIEAKTGISWE
jgi:hypothetical protein